MINISCAAIACSIILSSVKLEKKFSIAERVSSRLLTSPPLSLPKTIEFISSGANKQKIKLLAHSQCNVRASKNAKQAYFLGSSSLLTSPPLSLPKTIEFISSGANKQKIKLLAHSQCNVRASKNAEQAFSTQ